MSQAHDSDDGMDEFMDKFVKEKYKGAFNESTWEEEFDKVPMFMKSSPRDIDPENNPELACLQSIIHDDDRPPEEQARSLKDEGNEYFREKNYTKAIGSYTEGLKRKCGDSELNAILYTNRAAAHYHIGNIRSALHDASAAKKLKPDHLKALVRGAQCCMELRSFSVALQWCEEGLLILPTDKKLQDLRAAADKHKRAAERDVRKANVKEKKERLGRETLLQAMQDWGIKLSEPDPTSKHCDDDGEEEEMRAAVGELDFDGLRIQEATGSHRVHLGEQGLIHWPVLFLYPEHNQTDFISSFCESDRFIDHLTIMFGEELAPWDTDRKYKPNTLQLYFEDEQGELFQLDTEMSLLAVLQHKRCFVKGGTPSFFVLVNGSSFCKAFLSGKRVHRVK